MCQRDKEGCCVANCSLPEDGEARRVACPITNTTFLNPLLKCRYVQSTETGPVGACA